MFLLLLTLGSLLACEGALLQQMQLRVALAGMTHARGAHRSEGDRHIVERALGPGSKHRALLPTDPVDDDDETDSDSDTVAAHDLEPCIASRVEIVILAMTTGRDAAIALRPALETRFHRISPHAPRGPPIDVV